MQMIDKIQLLSDVVIKLVSLWWPALLIFGLLVALTEMNISNQGEDNE